MSAPFQVRRKTRLSPVAITVEVGDEDEHGNDITRTLEFRCRPHISGDDMLTLTQLVDTPSTIAVGIRQFFDLALQDEDKAKWADFLKSPNSPDAAELADIAMGMINTYSNRVDENPTNSTA